MDDLPGTGGARNGRNGHARHQIAAFDARDRGGSAGPRIGAVLPGGGARGAYEAGALSVLAPALQARGERISIACGTSVGAINAAFLASTAHLPLDEQIALALDTWRGMRKHDVIRSVIGPSLVKTGLRLAGELLDVPGVRVAGLMDPSPLAASLERWIDWDALRHNVDSRRFDALCVVATALSGGGAVGFVHTAGRVPTSRAADDLRYVGVDRLLPDHVRASAAIPLLFPPVEVTEPAEAADAYIDGGVRLNAPIAPTLALGADRVIVIGFEPFAARAPVPGPLRAPRMSDVGANVLSGLLVDQVADDLHRLAAINAFMVEGSGLGVANQAARTERLARGKPAYRRIPYVLVAPEKRGRIAELADQVFEERYSGLKGWRHPDLPVVSRLLGGGRSRSRGELLSFLLFDERFVELLIAEGAKDAERWLDRHPHVWCSDAPHDLMDHHGGAADARERATLDEWRSLRRR
ncbi:patatin-like phospholipase family protein [Patulibacter sp. SYSU D01012]|uniref:patatin-like phospholipase family protein n=1 Tax=Patulibacter sp. SYSU D01012 TaxID=2817381 RepID=UPI001B310153|nr:patatin-like phospholipase family protein [Patulibacter sp. SYSU D01012]